MSPIITVIIPAYNAAQYLAETLQSVLDQTYKEFEVLVIDDGSTDQTPEIVQTFSQQDPRIRLIPQSNAGVSTARNTGIQQARGQFLAFLDADDLWLPNKLACHLQHLQSDDSLGVSYGKVEFMQEDSTPTGHVAKVRLSNLRLLHLYSENPACTPSNVVVRREIFEQIDGFDPHLSGLADLEFCLKVACAGWKVEGLDQVLVKYRIVGASMSSQLNKMEEEWATFSRLVYAYAPELVGYHYRSAKAMFLRYIARRALRSHPNPEVGLDFINRAVKTDWTLLFREPKRTLLTLFASYARSIFHLKNSVFS